MSLSQEQLRLLGCLVEKERTTPDDYPLTSNSLMRAANQSTSRDPVVDYDQGLVEREMATLKEQGLVRFVHSQSNRAMKYRQVIDEAWGVDDAELALLALLMLRGPQTPGELRSRAGRLASFVDVSDVRVVLERLAAREEPMVVELERLPGHKESRWMQLLGDGTVPEPTAGSRPAASPAIGASMGGASTSGISTDLGSSTGIAVSDRRLEMLEAEVRELRSLVDELRVELGLAVSDPD